MSQDLGTIFYFDWELRFLHFLQSIHNPILDSIMLFFTNFGSNKTILLIFILALAIFPKTRRIGIQMFIALIVSTLIVNVGLKPFIMRCRPCWLEPGIKLLIERPHSHSFPSGHTNTSFALAMAVFLSNKKIGIPSLIIASTIAFSRLYLFVHWLTDVMGGIVTGIVSALISYGIIELFNKQFNKVFIKKAA